MTMKLFAPIKCCMAGVMDMVPGGKTGRKEQAEVEERAGPCDVQSVGSVPKILGLCRQVAL